MVHRHILKIFSRRYSRSFVERHRSHTPLHLFAEDMNLAEADDSEEKADKEEDIKVPKEKRPKYLVAIHTAFHKPDIEKHIKAALDAGYKTLEETGRSLEAVESACRRMETNPVFNCGKGSPLTTAGTVEMEASIMDGDTLKSGSICGLYNIEHPVTLARMVMDKTPHISIAGEGSSHLAQSFGFPRVPPQSLITEEAKEAYAKHVAEHPGVAAVIALDPDGNLATAMSSGGMRRKLPGRIGCSAIIGSGFYADNNIAAVTTSDNSAILRADLAYDIVQAIGKGLPPLESAQKMLLKLQLRLYRKGGVMVVTKHGDVAIALTKDKMDWAFKRDKEYKFGNTEGYYKYNVK